jgi:hypothetical protein
MITLFESVTVTLFVFWPVLLAVGLLALAERGDGSARWVIQDGKVRRNR